MLGEDIMNKRKILRCLLSVSIVGSLFCLGSMEAFAEWRNESGSWKCVENGSNVTGWHKYNSTTKD